MYVYTCVYIYIYIFIYLFIYTYTLAGKAQRQLMCLSSNGQCVASKKERREHLIHMQSADNHHNLCD